MEKLFRFSILGAILIIALMGNEGITPNVPAFAYPETEINLKKLINYDNRSLLGLRGSSRRPIAAATEQFDTVYKYYSGGKNANYS